MDQPQDRVYRDVFREIPLRYLGNIINVLALYDDNYLYDKLGHYICMPLGHAQLGLHRKIHTGPFYS